MKGTLKNGFKYEVGDNIMDDMEFVEIYRAAQDDALKYIDLLEKLLGKEQKQRLYDSLRSKDGIVHVQEGDYTVTDAVAEIFDAIRESGTAGKN